MDDNTKGPRLRLDHELTPKECATMLAALRFWQRHLEQDGEVPIDFGYFEDDEALTVAEIDVLCESINLSMDNMSTTKEHELCKP